MRILITAGPTREHIDPVRFLSNGSSGKMGYALAAAAQATGAEVVLVSGPVALAPPAGVACVPVVSAQEMFEACQARFADCDVFIAVAAVADFRPARTHVGKVKKAHLGETLELVPTVDILHTLAQAKSAQQIVVGFAAETDDVERNARKKLEEKGCDWIVANDVSAVGLGMNADDNEVVLWSRDRPPITIPRAPKSEVAQAILRTIFGGTPGAVG